MNKTDKKIEEIKKEFEEKFWAKITGKVDYYEHGIDGVRFVSPRTEKELEQVWQWFNERFTPNTEVQKAVYKTVRELLHELFGDKKVVNGKLTMTSHDIQVIGNKYLQSLKDKDE